MRQDDTEWINWSRNQKQTTNVEVVHPRDEAQLAQVVREATAKGRTVRAVGTGHAWAEIVANEGQPLTVVKLDKWNETQIQIDWDDATARIPARLSLKEATAQLARFGYQLYSPPVYVDMNMGGLVGTASHGTGDGKTETMSDHLVGFRMVTADGTVVGIDKDKPLRDEDRELLKAVRCSMGSLGVLYELTLRICPAYYVREDDTLVPLDEGIERMVQYAADNEFVETFWMPYTPKMWVKTYNRHPRVHYGLLNRTVDWLKGTALYSFQRWVYPGILHWLGKRQDWAPTANKAMGALIPAGSRVVKANEAFHFQKTIPRIIASAWVVRTEDMPDLWRFILAKVQQWSMLDRNPAAVILESRFIRRSQELRGGAYEPSILLSPAVFDDTAYVELVGYYDVPGLIQAFKELEDGILENFPEARPHWGKYFYRGKYLADLYNKQTVRGSKDHWRMARFLRVRKQLDPSRAMSNAFLNGDVYRGPEKPPAGFDGLDGKTFRGNL